MTEFKWFAVLIIFAAGLAGGYYPFVKRLAKPLHEAFPLGESFATGIFLAVGLVHMLPDSLQLFQQAFPTITYPLGTVIAGVTFLFLLLLEHWAMSLSHTTPSETANPPALAYVLVFLLAIHSFLMGTALGIETHFAAILLIFIAIISHKSSASFALAVNLAKSSLKTATAIVLFGLFLIMTPLGILMGAEIHNYLIGNAAVLAKAIFFSIGAGTFLYMSTLHGLKRNPMIEHCCNMKEFSIMALGFALMALIGCVL